MISTQRQQDYAESSKHALHRELYCAQRELAEQEIFDELIKEASYLPTMSARVSERQIAIEAAQGVELRFDLVSTLLSSLFQLRTFMYRFQVDSSLVDDQRGPAATDIDSAVCDLVYASLHALLLRAHAHRKKTRLKSTGMARVAEAKSLLSGAMILHPIIDIVQYYAFCEQVKQVLYDASYSLGKVGVDTELRFDIIGESGCDIIKLLAEDTNTRSRVGGEAVLRIDSR